MNEGTPLCFDTTPAHGFSAADTSGSGCFRSITPDFASESVPLRYSSHSSYIHKVSTPVFISASSKADLIPELLKRDNPWNAIGDMLDLPPIPTANETYFKEITSHRSHHSVSPVQVSPLVAPSSMGQPDIMPSSSARIEDTRQRVPQSDGALPARKSDSPMNKSSHGVSSPLLCGVLDSTTKTAINLASPPRVGCCLVSSGQWGTHTPSSPVGKITIPDRPSQPSTPLAPSRGSYRPLGRKYASACVAEQTLSGIAAPLLPISKPLHLPTTSALSSSDSMHWHTVSEIDLDELIPKTPSTTRTQRPKHVCPDFIADERTT